MNKNLRLALTYVVGLLFIAGVVLAFLAVNANAHTKDVSMTTNDIKAAVQPAPDSGLMTCQALAERASMPGPKPKLSYQEVQGRFLTSRHSDVRDAGVKLIDTMQRVDMALNSDETPLSESMGAVMALRIAWSGLQTACANHGVDVPDLPS